jgi:hypothetical protein
MRAIELRVFLDWKNILAFVFQYGWFGSAITSMKGFRVMACVFGVGDVATG